MSSEVLMAKKVNVTIGLEPMMSRSELAALLGVSKNTIAELEVENHLPAIRLNQRLIRYRQSDVERLLADAMGTD
jgi:excisionase family DNA binding protein